MTTEPTNSEQDLMAEDDELSEGALSGAPAKEPRILDIAVLELPPGAHKIDFLPTRSHPGTGR